jgi:purine-binding chemotaxis protein CheW
MARHRHDPSKDLVGFLVGDVMYAVRIEVVREIVNPLPVVELPRAPVTVKGVADYRGEVVPIVDLRERFGLEPAQRSRRTKWIVLDTGPRRPGVASSPSAANATSANTGAPIRYAALVVDAVTEVFGLAGGELRPAPPLGVGDEARGIEGVTTLGSRLVFVLDARSFGPVTQAALVATSSSSSSATGALPVHPPAKEGPYPQGNA